MSDDSDDDYTPKPYVRRPPSAYLLFARHARHVVQAENPNVRIGQIVNLVSMRWNDMAPEQRQPFVNEASQLLRQYQRMRNTDVSQEFTNLVSSGRDK